ncbi:conserved hypothetical protein [Ricinus communis]|uniref:Uncharacterized protein n=1 Tax=Ricinus communis TaxID=3988 RepID=B9ST95_RICCO|nr:conserved hypothetical protein [Ricinus communis]
MIGLVLEWWQGPGLSARALSVVGAVDAKLAEAMAVLIALSWIKLNDWKGYYC